MEPSLHHTVVTEGAVLYRDIRTWKARMTEELHGPDGTAAPGTGPLSRRLTSPLHTYYPLLFRTFCRDVPWETVRELARADRFYAEHLLFYDRTLDGPRTTDTTGLFLAQLEHMQSLKSLYLLFPAGHPFWDYFSGCYLETWKSVREERLHHFRRIEDFPIARFCSLAKGKCALLRPFSAALAFLARKTHDLHRLSTSLDQHHIGLVLIDDLEDWRQDFQNGNFTYLLTRVIQKCGLVEHVRSDRSVPQDRLGRLLHTTGLLERQLRLAEIFFQKSNETVGALPLPLWKSFNNGFRARCRALRYDLAEIRRREEGRVRTRASRGRAHTADRNGPCSDTVSRQLRSAARFLAGSLEAGDAFPLSLSPHAYMCPSTRIAPSRFVTVLAIRSLQTLKTQDPAIDSLLATTSARLRWMRGTDRHPELPAALEIPFEPMTPHRRRLSILDRSFTPAYGPIPNGLFWANLLYICSTASFRPSRLGAFVADCLLRSHYTPWSQGVAFGPVAPPWTRYACRPLLPLLLFSQALGTDVPQKAFHDYLLAPYRATGLWNDTTQTALTLLCLTLTGYDGPELLSAVSKLVEAQEPDGSWAPNAVYRKRTGSYYGSRALTTAWCIEALARSQTPVARGPCNGRKA